MFKELGMMLGEAQIENAKFKQALAEIKDLLLKTPTDSPQHCINAKSEILQKISEVIDEEV